MFGFNDAEVNKGSYKETIEPGIHTVKVVKVTNGLSTQKQAPYIEFTVEDASGRELKNQYYLSTTVNPGKQKSAWDISKNAILSLVAAANRLDETSAKGKMPNAKSAEELAEKLAILLTGKEFEIKVVGEEKISQKGTKYVASSFGQGVFCQAKGTTPTTLFFSADKNIKRLPAGTESSTTENTTHEGISAPIADVKF